MIVIGSQRKVRDKIMARRFQWTKFVALWGAVAY